MWRTSEGRRKLVGRERSLFVAAVVRLYDQLSQSLKLGEAWPAGVRVFDRLPDEERPYVLLDVAGRILGSGRPPTLAAWNEGTVLAIYESIRSNIIVEIDNHHEWGRWKAWSYWRRLLQSAWLEKCWDPHDKSIPWGKGEGPRQSVGSADLDEWESKVECLTDRVLHDRDCEDEIVLDSHPAIAGVIHAELGIDPDYFTGLPPLLSDRKKRSLEKLYDQLAADADAEYAVLCPARKRRRAGA